MRLAIIHRRARERPCTRGHALVALCQCQGYRTWAQTKRAGHLVQAVLT